ncbi:hypothetical protein KYB31_07910 [Clostridium felsineum]|uniref:DUF6103 family protein n=1 Tax=Clostridium felsineum TaxID=36839 RepID=UPI00214DD968|nr:DUF6103 family protein [Clostridium felsineum]MCR3758914.1 hypothetical protein [Clostridium felsineum]
MAVHNKKVALKINYNEEKLKALRVVLEQKNKNLDKEIENYIEGLYQKNVPKILKVFIENNKDLNDKNEED